MHSQASDGVLTPSELVHLAANRGLNLMALTDHDTLLGIGQAKETADELGIGFIPGIEISCEGDLEVHVLGYFIHPGDRTLDALIERIQEDRISREDKYLNALDGMGIRISHEDLQIPSGTMFSRPLLAKAMLDRGYVSSIQQAFEKYIGAGRPAYVEKLAITVHEAAIALRQAGAVPVLAHPGLIRMEEPELLSKLEGWIHSGLMGIEAYHPAHSAQQCEWWAKFARHQELLVTGGSDYHRGKDRLHGEPGQMLQLWDQASKDAQRLIRWSEGR